MADIGLIFSEEELSALDQKQRATLTKHALRLVRTSPEIRNIIKKDPKVRKILGAELRPLYNRLKQK